MEVRKKIETPVAEEALHNFYENERSLNLELEIEEYL